MGSDSGSKPLQATLLVVAALLFLVCTRGQAARLGPAASSDHVPQHRAVDSTTGDREKSGGSGPAMMEEMHQEEPAEAVGECEGGDEGEECLMRRTLAAHTDYIYTQGKHN